MYQLKITRPSSVLSTITNVEVTATQVNSIIALLEAPDLTYGEMLFFLANRNQLKRHAADFDAPEGAGESVEAFRG